MGDDAAVAAETGEFYEDDEPIEDILAAWGRSRKGVTAPPARGFNLILQLGSGARVADVGQTAMVRSLALRPDQPMFTTG